MSSGSERFKGHDSHYARERAREGRGQVLAAKSTLRIQKVGRSASGGSAMAVGTARFVGHDSHYAKEKARGGRGGSHAAKSTLKIKKGLSVGMRSSKHRRFSSLGCVYGLGHKQQVPDKLGDGHEDITRHTRGGTFRVSHLGRFEEHDSHLNVEHKEGDGESRHAIGFDHEDASERLKKIGGIQMKHKGRHSRFSMVGTDFGVGAESMAATFK